MLYRELKSVGLLISGYNPKSSVITWSGEPNQTLADIVIAATEKPFASPEVQALKVYLGQDSDGWKGYVAERRRPVLNERQAQYKRLVDSVFFDLFFDATSLTDNGDGTVSLRFNKAKLQELATIRQQIKADNPFPA